MLLPAGPDPLPQLLGQVNPALVFEPLDRGQEGVPVEAAGPGQVESGLAFITSGAEVIRPGGKGPAAGRAEGMLNRKKASPAFPADHP